MIVSFSGGGGGLVFGGGAWLFGGSSVCDDLGSVSTGDKVMLTSPPEGLRDLDKYKSSE